MSYKSPALPDDAEPKRSSSPEFPVLKAILSKAYIAAVRSNQDSLLEELLKEYINQLGINSASQNLPENLEFLLNYLKLGQNASLSAKLICILMYKNENMQRHILSVKSFIKFGRIIYFNVPNKHEESTLREIEKCAIFSENSPSRICYLFPESEDLPHYKPEKILDCFRISSDALQKLLQEPSQNELPAILEISSVDNESQRKSPVYSVSSNPRFQPESTGKSTISKRNLITDNMYEVENTTQNTEAHSQVNASKYESVLMPQGNSLKNSQMLTGQQFSVLTEGDMARINQKSALDHYPFTNSPTPKFSTDVLVSYKKGGRSNSTSVSSNATKNLNQIDNEKSGRRPSQPGPSRFAPSRKGSSQMNTENQSFELSNPNNKSFDFVNKKPQKNFRISGRLSSSTRKTSSKISEFENSRVQELHSKGSQSRPRAFSGTSNNSQLNSTLKMNSSGLNNKTSLIVLEDEKPHQDQQLNTPLSREVYQLLKRTENEKYIAYVQKLKEHEKPILNETEYLNPLATDLKKENMSTTKKRFVEDYNSYFEQRAQTELGTEQKEGFKVVKPVDKLLYLRLAPRTVLHHKWKYQPAKYRLANESVVIPEFDYKIQPPKAPSKPIKKRLNRTLRIEELWDNALNDDKRAAYLEDEFHLDVTSNLEDYLENLNDLKSKNEKIFGAKYSYYTDVLRYHDSKHEDGNLSPKTIKYADQEVDYLLQWKRGNVDPEYGIDALQELKNPKKKKKIKDVITQQENYFPKAPAFIDRSGFLVANTEEPEEFLQVQNKNSNKKPSRGKRTRSPLLDTSPLPTESSPMSSPKKSQADVFDFKISLSKLPSQ